VVYNGATGDGFILTTMAGDWTKIVFPAGLHDQFMTRSRSTGAGRLSMRLQTR